MTNISIDKLKFIRISSGDRCNAKIAILSRNVDQPPSHIQTRNL